MGLSMTCLSWSNVSLHVVRFMFIHSKSARMADAGRNGILYRDTVFAILPRIQVIEYIDRTCLEQLYLT